jgi:hypothetical protein
MCRMCVQLYMRLLRRRSKSSLCILVIRREDDVSPNNVSPNEKSRTSRPLDIPTVERYDSQKAMQNVVI